ncbi:Acyltransferase family protein [Variovorax sp. PBS-H4]|nr:Acyltransferase family protein [Variovorax sp. PBS-H4]
MSIFFLLSGFVLTYRYQDGSTSIRSYLLNRFARIYPVYVAAAVVTLPWFGVASDGSAWSDILASFARGAFLLLANILLIQAWFVQLFPLWNVGSSWSISVEAFCYVILPFFLPTLVKLSWRLQKLIMFACVVLAALPGLSAKLFPTTSAGVFYSMPIFRLPEFLLGCCVCLAWQSGRLKPIGNAGQFVLILLFCIYLGIAGPMLPLYVGHNWISIPVIALVTLNVAHGKSYLAALLSTRPFVWLGKISYSFYSFQALVILMLVNYHDRWVRRFSMLENNLLLAIVTFVVLLLISALSHHLIEEPARRLIRRYRGQQPRMGLSL